MNKRFLIGVSILFCSAACSVVWAADYQPLSVKTGQWENTMTSQSSGTPPIPDQMLKQLTPEQLAKLKAAMQARVAEGSKPTVHKGCLTKEDLNKAFDWGDERTKTCSRTIVTSSGSRQEIRLDCTFQGVKTSGTVKVEAEDSEHVKGTIQMTSTNGEHTMNTNYTFAAKWIGPACTEK